MLGVYERTKRHYPFCSFKAILKYCAALKLFSQFVCCGFYKSYFLSVLPVLLNYAYIKNTINHECNLKSF